jgi:hypothetical protein
MIVWDVSTKRRPDTRRWVKSLSVVGVRIVMFGTAIVSVLLVFIHLIE